MNVTCHQRTVLENTVTLIDTTYEGCNHIYSEHGGAFYLSNSLADVTITGCQFHQCRADDEHLLPSGGALWMNPCRSFSMTATSAIECAAREFGGFCLVCIGDSTFGSVNISECVYYNCRCRLDTVALSCQSGHSIGLTSSLLHANASYANVNHRGSGLWIDNHNRFELHFCVFDRNRGCNCLYIGANISSLGAACLIFTKNTAYSVDRYPGLVSVESSRNFSYCIFHANDLSQYFASGLTTGTQRLISLFRCVFDSDNLPVTSVDIRASECEFQWLPQLATGDCPWPTRSQTPTASPSPSEDFRASANLSTTAHIHPSEAFSASREHLPSDNFSDSAKFVESQDFNESFPFIGSSRFTESLPLADSMTHPVSHSLVQSASFKHSESFQSSRALQSTGRFAGLSLFSTSKSSSMSDALPESDAFKFTNNFSASSSLHASATVVSTLPFSASRIFGASEGLAASPQFSASRRFIGPSAFSASHPLTGSSTIDSSKSFESGTFSFSRSFTAERTVAGDPPATSPMVPQMATKSDGSTQTIIIGIAAALLLLAIMAVIIVILIQRKRRRSPEKELPETSTPQGEDWMPDDLNSVYLTDSDECLTQEQTSGGSSIESAGSQWFSE
jgi:hypothetical protein